MPNEKTKLNKIKTNKFLTALLVTGLIVFAIIIVPSLQLAKTVVTKEPAALAGNCKVCTINMSSSWPADWLPSCTGTGGNCSGTCDDNTPSYCTANCGNERTGCGDVFCGSALDAPAGQWPISGSGPLDKRCESVNGAGTTGGNWVEQQDDGTGVSYNKWRWQCQSNTTGHTIGCGVWAPADGLCGSENGTTGATAPADSGKCISLSGSSATAGSGPWDWNCYGAHGGTSAVCHKYKTPVANAPTCTLTASPATVSSGGSSTLSWSTTDATSFSINGGAQTLNGTASTGALYSTSVYNGTVSGSGGTGNCSATVNVTTASCTTPTTQGSICNTCNNGSPSGYNTTTGTWTCNPYDTLCPAVSASCSVAATNYYCSSSNTCASGTSCPSGKACYSTNAACVANAATNCPVAATNYYCSSSNTCASGTSCPSGKACYSTNAACVAKAATNCPVAKTYYYCSSSSTCASGTACPSGKTCYGSNAGCISSAATNCPVAPALTLSPDTTGCLGKDTSSVALSWHTSQAVSTGQFGTWLRNENQVDWYGGALTTANGGSSYSASLNLSGVPAGDYRMISAYKPVANSGDWTIWGTGGIINVKATCSTLCSLTGRSVAITADKTQITSGETVNFTLGTTGLNLSTIDFGDGSNPVSATPTISHVYTNTTATNVVYQATVTACCATPNYPCRTSAINITISATPPRVCTVNLLANGVNPLTLPADVGGAVSFTGSGTGDINDYTLSYPSSIFPDYHKVGTLTATPVAIGDGTQKIYTRSAISGLTGRYYEGAMNKLATTCTSQAAINVPIMPALSCQSEPTTGKAPMPVHFTVTAKGFDATAPYQFDMDDPNGWIGWQNNTGGNLWYTFTKSGTYHPAVRHPNFNSNQAVPCYTGTGLTVSSPTDSRDNEVAPGN